MWIDQIQMHSMMHVHAAVEGFSSMTDSSDGGEDKPD